MLYSLLFRQVEAELSQYLFMHVSMLDVRDVSVDHEGHQVENQVRALPQNGESSEAKLLETCVVHGLDTAHRIYHLLADLHWRCERFGISTENVSEVDCEPVRVSISATQRWTHRGRNVLHE